MTGLMASVARHVSSSIAHLLGCKIFFGVLEKGIISCLCKIPTDFMVFEGTAKIGVL